MGFLQRINLVLTVGALGIPALAYSVHAAPVSLRDLAPVQVYAVSQVAVDAPVELPDIAPADDAEPGQGIAVHPLPAHPGTQGAPIASTVPVVNLSQLDTSLGSLFDQRGSGVLPPWNAFQFGASTAMQATVFRDRSSWLSTLPSKGGWARGSENWRYTDSRGVGLTLGNEWTDAPSWSRPARMGGVRLSRAPAAGSTDADPWRYSVMAGVLDYSADSADQADLLYGSAASTSVVQYEISPAVTLGSQVEWAPDLLTTGLGAEYDTGQWGAWSAGMAKATRGPYQGWRYQTGYRIRLSDKVQLSWVGEQRSGGFSDLARYRDFSPDSGRTRNRWSATVPLGRWGDLTGGYENTDLGGGEVQQSFGVSQQFWYSPNLRVALQAERELQSGAYDVGLQFSVPIP